MKKGLIFLLSIVSFLGINTVSAKEIYLEYDTNISYVKSHIDEIGYEKINKSINELINYYNTNLSVEYSYYFISLNPIITDINGNTDFFITLTSFDQFSNYIFDHFNQIMDSYVYLIDFSYNGFYRNIKQISYNLDTNEIFEDFTNFTLFKLNSDEYSFYPYNYYYSNFDLYHRGDLLTDNALTYLKPDDILYIPSYSEPSSYFNYNANSKFLIEPYYLYDDNSSLEDNRFTTINLNDYSYVIFSLKDYSERETFSSLLYLKGQICITPVYKYGLEEKKDYISGWQSPPCTGVLQEYTSNYLTIKEEDINNHVVYYITGYDYSIDNLIKIDESTFDITYITKENENNPNVIINGKNYSILPYSSLTDTAELTEKNGLNGTFSCAKYDTDCFMDSSGIDVESLFTSPLETLETIWDVITSVFKLITEFISLLPPTLQAFLYLAFGVGVALGIIKIIL